MKNPELTRVRVPAVHRLTKDGVTLKLPEREQIREVFTSISRCPNVRRCLETDAPHDCRAIVDSQRRKHGVTSYVDFQLPEPWVGEIDVARSCSFPRIRRSAMTNTRPGPQQMTTFGNPITSLTAAAAGRTSRMAFGRPTPTGIRYRRLGIGLELQRALAN